jgi:hypothetical protein
MYYKKRHQYAHTYDITRDSNYMLVWVYTKSTRWLAIKATSFDKKASPEKNQKTAMK